MHSAKLSSAQADTRIKKKLSPKAGDGAGKKSQSPPAHQAEMLGSLKGGPKVLSSASAALLAYFDNSKATQQNLSKSRNKSSSLKKSCTESNSGVQDSIAQMAQPNLKQQRPQPSQVKSQSPTPKLLQTTAHSSQGPQKPKPQLTQQVVSQVKSTHKKLFSAAVGQHRPSQQVSQLKEYYRRESGHKSKSPDSFNQSIS
jgi:hypothetical protein